MSIQRTLALIKKIMIFKQLNIKLQQKEFEIQKDGLRIISKTLSGRSEDYYMFEDVGDVITIEKRRLLIPLFISLLFFGMSTILLIGETNGGNVGYGAITFYYFVGGLFLCVFFFFGKNLLYLSTKDRRTHIEFLNNNPSKKKLQDFLTQLQKEKAKRLIEKYSEYDEDKTYEEHRHQLKWLKNNEFLTPEEYRNKLLILDTYFHQSESSNLTDEKLNQIGFKK